MFTDLTASGFCLRFSTIRRWSRRTYLARRLTSEGLSARRVGVSYIGHVLQTVGGKKKKTVLFLASADFFQENPAFSFSRASRALHVQS